MTVPSFATAHTFCASRDGPRNVGFLTVVPAKTKVLFAVYNCRGKEDVGNGYWNLKRKLGVTTHFSEVIKLQCGEKCYTLFCILELLELLLFNCV